MSKWVLPVSGPPIRDGAVVVAGDRIAAVGPAAEVLAGFTGMICDHGDGAILPGLVNCHVHLEFSALAGKVAPQARWEDWLEATLATYGALSPEEIEAGIALGMEALWQSGAVLVGEVTNTGASWPHLETGPLAYHLFYECLGFDLVETFDLPEKFPFFGRPEVAAAARVSAAAHAPYSVSAALFRAVAEWNTARSGLQMVHLAESQAEIDFLARGNGFFEGLLKRRGRWVQDFQPPGPGAAAYLEGLGFLGPRTLTVHGTQLTAADWGRLAETKTWLVLCPRANRYTGAGEPPVPELLQAGVNLALGTDSLAGNWDLNLFGEMLWLHRNFPAYPGDLWLRLGTLNGAQAMGRDREFGSLEPGKKAALGVIPLKGGRNFWGELFTAGAAGKWRWIG
ncbi:MAG: amidohydrolase family protein [Proteobacteria bacterium]|nr:amidohydrolase family protein [Pseudomonadota bacterium]